METIEEATTVASGFALRAARRFPWEAKWLWVGGMAGSLLLFVVAVAFVGSHVALGTVRGDSNDEKNELEVVTQGTENLKPVALETGRYQIHFTNCRSGIRAIVWRYVERGGVTTATVRLSCGVWLDQDSVLSQLANLEWVERTYVQLEPQTLDELIEQLEKLDSVSYQRPSSDMGYRELEVQIGNLRFRKLPDREMEVMIPLEDRDLWDQVDADELLAFLRSIRKQMSDFDRRSSTITWR